MQVLEKIKTSIDELDEITFYKYLIGLISCVALAMIFMIFQYYKSSYNFKKQLAIINEFREQARDILTKNKRVEQRRKRVNEILEKDEDFLILEFFEDRLTKLNIKNRLGKINFLPSVSRDDNYSEVLLEARLDNMNMKSVCELLNEIEQKEIVYTKKLELTKAKKIPPTLEVTITIATLQRKQQQPELVE